ncbi:hypothetical protein NSTC731_04689 [Nostoc sp. DSM 114167]|jgi:hypothetical protein
MIPASVQKPGKPLSPCPLLPAPCGLNDKSLTGHDITGGQEQGELIYNYSSGHDISTSKIIR